MKGTVYNRDHTSINRVRERQRNTMVQLIALNVIDTDVIVLSKGHGNWGPGNDLILCHHR